MTAAQNDAAGCLQSLLTGLVRLGDGCTAREPRGDCFKFGGLCDACWDTIVPNSHSKIEFKQTETSQDQHLVICRKL